MEKLKKTILQAVTTGLTACTASTTGFCHIIVPDLSVTYHMKIGLKQVARDLGFFDAYVEFVPPIPPVPPEPPTITFYLEDDNDDILIDNYNYNYTYQ
jgi:hypothetical protein